MTDRHIAQDGRYPTNVAAGRTYHWVYVGDQRRNRSAMAGTRIPTSSPSHGQRKPTA
jgi:hypothetical protein